jgi:MFS superfamily sulfate permease-like transporter
MQLKEGSRIKEKHKFSFTDNLRYDLPAGLVVFLVALPLCLGIALASGAPLFSGVIAGVVGGLVVASVSGSALSVSGPAAGLTVIVATAITQLGSFEAFLLAVVLAGVIQIVLGLAKAGIIGYYFPSSVIKGMLAAIGLLLILKQIPHALGYDFNFEGDESFEPVFTNPNLQDQSAVATGGENTLTELYHAFLEPHVGAVIISVISLAILILWDRPFIQRIRVLKQIPAPLLVVIAGIIINELFLNSFPLLALTGNHLVNLPVAEKISKLGEELTFPDYSLIGSYPIYITAVTIAIVASLESLLSIEAADKLDPYKRNTPASRELIAQGVGNMVSGLIGGLPVTAVIVRSSANINSGAKTKVSAITHGVFLLASVLFIPFLLNKIPLSCLAAILLIIGYKLSRVSLYKHMYKIGMDQFVPFTVTIAAILFTDLLRGIAIGMVFSIFFILRNNYKTSYYLHKENGGASDIIKLVLSQEVSFLNKANIQSTLDRVPDNAMVIIDGSLSEHIDYDVLEIIHNFKQTAHSRNINLELINIRDVPSLDAH